MRGDVADADAKDYQMMRARHARMRAMAARLRCADVGVTRHVLRADRCFMRHFR